MRFFASILSRFSALFSNEVFAPVKKEVSVFIVIVLSSGVNFVEYA